LNFLLPPGVLDIGGGKGDIKVHATKQDIHECKSELKSEFKADINAAVDQCKSELKSEFKADINAAVDQCKTELNASIESLRSEMQSSFSSIAVYFGQLESYLDKKFTHISEEMTRVSDDVRYMRTNHGARFDACAEQMRIQDRSQFRLDDRLSDLEKRVVILEEKAS
jgi:hypothetical protein